MNSPAKRTVNADGEAILLRLPEKSFFGEYFGKFSMNTQSIF
jgi:hypothetical protein